MSETPATTTTTTANTGHEPDHHEEGAFAPPPSVEPDTETNTAVNSDVAPTTVEIRDVEASSQHSKTTDCVSVVALPSHLRPIARQIRKLSPEDLLTITDITQKAAAREVYSLLPYTGSNWYLPEIVVVTEGPRWGIDYSLEKGLLVTLGGRRMRLQVFGILLRFAILVLLWYALYNILGKNLMTPGGYVWDPLVTFIVSCFVGGAICRFLQVPPLLGVLWIAIMWHNIPTLGFLTSGIYKDVSKIAQRVGLTVVLARAGFSLSLKSVKPHMVSSLLLATMPYGFEVVAHGLAAYKLFSHDSYTWSFLEATVCSTIAPAIVVPGVLFLQEQGFAHGYGPGSLMLSAVSLEICLGVWAVNFIVGLIFNNTPLAVAIVLGPVQIIGGVIIGILAGVIFHYFMELIKREAQRLPNGKYASDHIDDTNNLGFMVFLAVNLVAVFLGYNIKLAGGGAVAAVFFSATVAHLWVKDGDRELEAHKMVFGRKLANTWDLLVMPALFSMVGVSINLKAIFNSTFFPKAIAVIAISTAVRWVVIVAVTLTAKLTWAERLVVSGGYMAKATGQATMGPLALASVNALIASQGLTPELAKQKERAQDILYLALLYVLVLAPVAALSIVKGGPLVLTKNGVKG